MEKNIINIDAHVIDDIRTIITRARNKAYQSINETLIRSNWEIGNVLLKKSSLASSVLIMEYSSSSPYLSS